jgi:small subunit ribosomal protein S1
MNSLLPIKNISINRILDLKMALKNKKNLKVIMAGKDENGKITLSHKELLGTWEQEANKFKVGETVIGMVRSAKDFGVFVELSPNLYGLAEINKDVKPGDRVTVFIKGIALDEMKIKLMIVNAEPAETNNTSYFEFDYRIPADRIQRWRYSPENCEKDIETIFYEE